MQVSYSAHDPDSTFTTVVFTYNGPNGQSYQVRIDNNAGLAATGTTTATVGSSWPSGSYQLANASLYDPASNYVTYTRSGTTYLNPSGATGPSSNPYDFTAEDFTVNNPTGGNTATPVLDGLSRVSAATVSPGDQVQVSYSAHDPDSTFTTVVFTYNGPNGQSYQVRIDNNAGLAATGTTTATVGSSWPSGSYQLANASLYDPASNYVTYTRSGTTYLNPSGATGPSSNPYDFTAEDFTVTSGTTSSDTAPPVLTAFDFTPRSVDISSGPASVTVTAHVTDQTGAQAPDVLFDSDNTSQTAGFGTMSLTSGTVKDGTYSRTITIPQDAATGTWTAVLYPLTDTLGNSQSGFGPGGSYPTTLTVTSGTTSSDTSPGAPINVVADPGDTTASVSWSPSGTGGSPITSYLVTAQPGGATATTTNGDTFTTVFGLTNGTSYTFTVTATNSVGTGPASSPSPAVSPTRRMSVPSAPRAVTATPGDASASVAWVAPSDDGGAPVDSYTVVASPGGRTVTVADVTTTVVTGLTNGTGYTFIVTAGNRIGTSTFSSPSSRVIPASPDATPTPPVITPSPPSATPVSTIAPASISLTTSRTFVTNGEPVTLTGGVTRAGAPAAGQLVTLSETYVDGKSVILTTTTTGGSDGTYATSVVPLYNGSITAAVVGATSTPAASRVILTFVSTTATAHLGRVTIKTSTAPGFLSGPGRAERAQILLLDSHGGVLRVIATVSAAQRHAAAGVAHGVNDVQTTVRLPRGAYRIAVKVLGTPVNTGAQSVTRTVKVP